MLDLIDKISLLWTNQRYTIVAVAFMLWIMFGSVAIKLLLDLIRKVVQKTRAGYDDALIREAKMPLWFLLFILGFFFISRTVGFPPKIMPYVDRFTQLSTVFLFIYLLARLVLNLIKLAARQNVGATNMVPTFSRLTNIIIWSVGLLMLMDIFGISITPVLASLGIAGLAIGLALQETLSNFFSGIYILISQPVRLGDYIELENGLKGYVTSIGWRETRIRMLQNNTVVIPNSKLSQSILTNYYIPQKEMACLVQVGVSYKSDLEKVEKVTVEVGREVLKKITGGVPDFDPFIRYHTFNDFSINFSVILRVSEFVDQYLVTHEFIKALHKRYNKEGIVIPFPIRTVQMEKA
jgi:small-conductance mechanosensitive channel